MSSRGEEITGNAELDETIHQYLAWNKDTKGVKEIENLITSKDVHELSKLFLKRLEFGTAGLRGRMGPGYSQLNDLVIIQTGQGLATYLMENVDDAKTRGIIIGYDARHNSTRYAQLTATIFLNYGFKVYLFSKVCPTPFIPFGILKYKCSAGIMITASHNPKEDNGYKVYWENGAQIIPPHDTGIQKSILNSLQPRLSSWRISILTTAPSLLKDPLDDIMEDYYKTIVKPDIIYPEINQNTALKITYTPMHGVGFEYMKQAFDHAQFKPFISVEEQKDPDPNFPTVKYPNPEEGKCALNCSIKTADANNSTIILANDPDADRLCCAVKNQEGNWHILTGNELGGLLAWWMLHVYRVKHPNASISHVYMLASTVSSKILLSMAKKEGFQFEETLTGFKWMGNKSIELVKEKKDVIFAYEEAIGFMCSSKLIDKDGINAGIRVAEMAAYLETMGMNLLDKLEEIYKTYGRHISDNSYWICYEQETIQKIFDRLRNFNLQSNNYPTSISEGKYKIIGIRDLTTGYDNTKPDNKAVLPVCESSQMITFSFDNGLVTTLRTSGTEPKIKYYAELCAPPELQDLDKLKGTLKEMVSAIVQEFLMPQENLLVARS